MFNKLDIMPHVYGGDIEDIIEGSEIPEEQGQIFHINKITFEERDKMREKTTQLNADSYKEIEFKYDQVLHQLSAWDLQLETLKSKEYTPRIGEHLKEMAKSITFLKRREEELETQLRKIAERKSDIFHTLRMPKRYGKFSNIKCSQTLRMVPEFDPNKPRDRFSTTWESLLITGEDENGLDLSETGYKLALTLRLKGEASDYVLTYKDKPLPELIGILEARFEKRQYKSDWIQKLKTFTKQEGESMITMIERLKYYVTKANLNKTSAERSFLESNIIIGKLKEVVSREMWMKLWRKRRKTKKEALISICLMHC